MNNPHQPSHRDIFHLFLPAKNGSIEIITGMLNAGDANALVKATTKDWAGLLAYMKLILNARKDSA